MSIKKSFAEAFEKHNKETVSKVKYTGKSVNTLNQRYKIYTVEILVKKKLL